MDQSPLDPSSDSANGPSEPPPVTASTLVEGLDLSKYPPNDPPGDMTLDLLHARILQLKAHARTAKIDTSKSLVESYDAAKPVPISLVFAMAELNDDIEVIAGQLINLLSDDIEAYHVATDPLHVARGAADEDQ